MLERVRALPWWLLIVACLTLGLAPFRPEPHVVEKVGMLLDGTLTRPLDVFDLLLHGTPWVLLALRGVAAARDVGDDEDRRGRS